MNRRILFSTFLLFAFSAVGLAQLKDTVTFRVYMGVQALDGKFLMNAGDTVRVVGSFNGWSTTDTTVRMTRNSLSDSIFILTTVLDSSKIHADTIFYKFYKTPRKGDYETIANNRVWGMVNGHHQTPLYFYNNDSTVHPPANVTFRVNMSIQMRQLGFQPNNGDIVRVAGSFNSWGSSTDTLKSTGPTDSIYTKTLTLNQGDQIQYKFLKTLRAGLDWENNESTASGNREYTVPVGGATLTAVWFTDDSVYVPSIQVNLLWQTDMSAMITLGWFNPSYDSVDVRGAFTGWSSTKLKSNFINPNIWEYTSQNLISPIGAQLPFKYYVRFKDSASAATRFAGFAWTGNVNGVNNANIEDGIGYEHPATQGDGNDLYTVTSSTNQTPQRSWYSQINPQGLLATTDTVTVTLSVNMNPALSYSNPFAPANDTLYLIWQDETWWAAQAKIQGINTFKRNVKMSRRGASDSVWTVSFKVIGKTHYGMMYTYQYRKGDASIVDQGGGLGGQNLYNDRFIPKTGGVWAKTYAAPTDKWQKNAPLPGESAPFTTDVSTKTPEMPLVYNLNQNYPNPFNPTTNISYTLPQQSNVKLRIYNILGQLIEELVNRNEGAGLHVVAFDASRLATGVYFYKLEAGNYTNVKKMLLLK